MILIYRGGQRLGGLYWGKWGTGSCGVWSCRRRITSGPPPAVAVVPPLRSWIPTFGLGLSQFKLSRLCKRRTKALTPKTLQGADTSAGLQRFLHLRRGHLGGVKGGGQGVFPIVLPLFLFIVTAFHKVMYSALQNRHGI